MAATKWSFRLTDKNRVPIGEILNASERKAKLGIRQIDTASFKIATSNDLVLPLFAEDTYLQVWQGSKIRFFGPVLSAEMASDESGSGADTIAVSAVSPSWRLTKRLSNKSPGPLAYPGTPDKADIARNEIAKTNSETGETGIETVATTCGNLGAYTIPTYAKVMGIIRELSNGFDGFDWQFTPLASGGVKLVRFEAAAVIGVQRQDIAFEYGTGLHNMRSCSFKRDLSGLLNNAYHITDNGPADPAGVVNVSNAASKTEHGIYEDVIESAGLYDITLRTNWTRENVEVRGVPRLIFTMTSDLVEGNGRTPEAFIDYTPGDFVIARLVKNNVRFVNGFVRCYNIEVSVDNNGTPTFTPTLVEEEGEGAEESS